MSQKIYTDLDIKGNTTIGSIANATTDTDKFLVSDNGLVKYRTGAEMLSDLGVAPGVASNVQHQVKAGVAINKGQAVYVTSADGTNMIVGLASNASEATSSKTMGLLDSTVAINGFANVITEGLLAGLNTSTAAAGDPVWLGTGGNLIYGLINKPYAPAHLVFIGIVTRVNASNGEIFVKVQNGFELNEIHDVDLKTTTPVNGDILGFNGTLWVNKTIAAWLGYTPANANGTLNRVSKFTSTGTTLGDSQIFDDGTNVGINTVIPGAKFHVYANNSGASAVYGGTLIVEQASAGSIQILSANTQTQSIRFGDPQNGQIGRLEYSHADNSMKMVTNAGTKLTIDSSGNTIASLSLRAPIFYDLDDTTYYINPADADVSAVLKGTVTIGGGTGGNYDEGLRIIDSSSFSVIAFGATGNSGPGRFNILKTSGDTFQLRNAASSVLWESDQSGNTWINLNLRTPIVYDLDNTAYYINPNGTSSLSSVIADNTIKSRKSQTNGDYTTAALWTESYSTTTTGIAFHISGTIGKFLEMRTNGVLYWDGNQVMTNSGTWGISITGNAGTATTLQTARNINGTSFNGSADITTANWGTARTITIGSTGKSVNGSANVSWTLAEIGAASSTHTHDLVRYSLAAPAFIDTLTTANFRTTLFGSTTNGYQISTSRWNSVPTPLTGLNQYGTMFAWAGSDTQGFIAMDYSAAALIVGGGNGDNINWSRRVLVEQSWTNSKYFDTGGEIYGTRFYDANNSAYYVDPADTTTSANLQSKITIQGGSSSATTMMQVVNSYGSPSIQTYYGAINTTSSFYVGNPAGTLYDAFGQNARFSLYYDRDNTAYYVDPATTSVLNRLSISFSDATYQSGITVTNTNTGAQAIAGVNMFSGVHSGSINMFSSGYMDLLNQNTTNGIIQFRPKATVSMYIDNVSSTSRVTIGGSNPASHPLRVTQQVSNVSIYADYDIVAYSDQSVKENIRPIENVLDRVNKSRGVLYDRIDSGEKNNIGFIAQELEAEFPELVVTNEDNTKAVKYQNAVAVLFEAVKEQQKQIEELKELVNKLITK